MSTAQFRSDPYASTENNAIITAGALGLAGVCSIVFWCSRVYRRERFSMSSRSIGSRLVDGKETDRYHAMNFILNPISS